ncbi:hypothetical protein [Flavobacterium sp.]|uniref:hypothetical protein n=1 Tax=Flavobacterium sp. TaxID=239 RepID=UPI0039E4BCD9
MDIGTLISYHKQEAAEGLSYIILIFSVILGLLGYIGSAKKIDANVRIVLVIVFSIFLTLFVSSLVDSMIIHDALHEEIRNFAAKNPGEFINGEQSKLYLALTDHMQPHHIPSIVLMGAGLGIVVNLGLLTIGEGKVFSFKKKQMGT